MSHRMSADPAQMDKEQAPIFDDYECLRNACRALGFIEAGAELEFKTGVSVGIEDDGKQLTTQGYEVRLPGWMKPCYFDIENRTRFFDNWPIYGGNHPDVLAGRRRMGEDGRWGNFEHMRRLEQAYCTQKGVQVVQAAQAAAAAYGDMVTTMADNEDELILEVETL